MKQKKYTIHPAANEFPLMSESEFRELVDDIKLNGQTDLIVVRTTAKGTEIIDGRNRQAACEEIGVEAQEKEWEGTEEEIIPYIISKNIRRRHLTPDQQAAIIVKLRGPVIKDEAKKDKKEAARKDKAPKKDNAPKGTVPQRIAVEAGVTEHKAKQLDAVLTHAPEVLPDIIAGKTTVKAAAKIAKAKAPPKKKEPKQPPSLLEMVGKRLSALMDKFPITEHKQVKEIIKTLISGKYADLAVATALEKELAKLNPPPTKAAQKLDEQIKKNADKIKAGKKTAAKKDKPKAKKKPSKKPAEAPEYPETTEEPVFG